MTLTEKRIGEIALAFVKNIMEHDVFIKDQKLTDSVAEAAVQEVLSKTPLIKGADITHDEFLQFFMGTVINNVSTRLIICKIDIIVNFC